MTNRSESLKQNVLANYLGNGWAALMSLAFIPLYIKYLGMEAYGLIGIYAILQASLALPDAGMSATLGREMSRFLGGAHTTESIRDLLRSIEITGIVIATLYGMAIWSCSGWLATNWLKVEKIPLQSVSHAFTIMGFITAMRLMEGLYKGAIIGLQKMVLFNVCNALMATLRSLGAVLILAIYSPTIRAYFIWQALVSILTLIIFVKILYTRLPEGQRSGRFSKSELIKAWPFAAGMLATTSLALLLTHLDKFILSKMLPLEEFGRYNLASAMAASLTLLITPIPQAYFPRLTEIFSSTDLSPAKQCFHRGAQLVAVIAGTAGCVVFCFGENLLTIWTGDITLGITVGWLLKVMTLGTMLNAFMSMPFMLPLAGGNSSLNAKINLVAVLFLAPANLIVTPLLGAIGAAWILVALNLGYLIIAKHYMFKMTLSSEWKKWLLCDVVKPFSGSLLTVGIYWLFTPVFPSVIYETIYISIAGLTAFIVSTIMASEMVILISRFFNRKKFEGAINSF